MERIMQKSQNLLAFCVLAGLIMGSRTFAASFEEINAKVQEAQKALFGFSVLKWNVRSCDVLKRHTSETLKRSIEQWDIAFNDAMVYVKQNTTDKDFNDAVAQLTNVNASLIPFILKSYYKV